MHNKGHQTKTEINRMTKTMMNNTNNALLRGLILDLIIIS
ncbi:hypothetical protein HMPREF0877_1233 [Weissella paramesenteroides ATCC 33313]|uniref:Uncharacterized protein n=1 Tax=Weissella paramesenteroides ATCC 33313 TaxID=585506 RepID=C5RB88_WEIPA|nr:hypothetical protein HMPREF0877_1233 [Weissella paramesenteroides ATCC 33313]